MRTPVGLTDVRDTGSGIGQGTVPGAIISAVNLDNGVKEQFHGNEDEDNDEDKMKIDDIKPVKYDNINVHPLLWQDDVFSLSRTVKSAQVTNDKMEKIMESKCLDLHPLKSCFLISGSKKARIKLQQKAEQNPIFLYGKKMKQVTVEKYLGCRSLLLLESRSMLLSQRG